MNLEQLNQQLGQLNIDYTSHQGNSGNREGLSNIQNMNQKNGKDYEARNDINERMNQFRHFDNDFALNNQYDGNTIINTNQDSTADNYHQLNHYDDGDGSSSGNGIGNINNGQQQSSIRPQTEDLRANMNSRLDNLIFDNPGNKLPSLVEIHQHNLEKNQNIGYNYKPVVQERSKSLYKSQANSRLEHYSPLARSSHFPVKKNIDVQSRLYEKSVNKISKKDLMNDRLNNLPTLSKTITIGKKGGGSDEGSNRGNGVGGINVSNDNRNITTTANQERESLEQVSLSGQYTMENQRQLPIFNDINKDCNNVVFNEYPMFSNY